MRNVPSYSPLRTTALAATFATAFATASCSLAPKYERPAAPISQQWPAAANTAQTSGAQGSAAADLGWRDVFSDDRLKSLIALALENNRDLRIAVENVELARAQYGIERSAQFPSINASGSMTRQHVPADLSTTGQSYTANQFSVGLGLSSFELDFFGRVRSLSQAALEQYLATEEARRSAQLSLIAQVSSQYFTSRALEEQVLLAKQTLETVRSSLDLTQRSYAAGQASELDLRTAQAQLETVRYSLATLEQQRAQSENALVLLVGRSLPSDLAATQPLGAERLIAELPAGVPSDLLQRRPDILQAEHVLMSANANIGAARAAFFPSISLTAFGGTASSDLSNLFKSGQSYWNFSPSINLPIFTGGRNRSNLKVAEAKKRIEIAQYEKAIQVAFREVSDALVTRTAVEAQITASAARVEAEQGRYTLSELRYRKGIDSYINVLSAQQGLFAAQQILVQARLARLTSVINLYTALGGGWQEHTVRTANAPAAEPQR